MLSESKIDVTCFLEISLLSSFSFFLSMTTQEFLEADKNEDGSYMVAVTHHKTGQYDKALVYVTNELHTLISRYYNGVRREQMFVGFYGTVMFPTSKGVVQERLDGSVNLFNGWVQKAGKFAFFRM